ncbi:SprB repeat-containing protein [uncultured Dokdonia sp.]|uniref:SprB repeat-containing protein n=1 Tax=uncultured Dokdonia sp. TaxID=575653 RepID=UPI0030EE7DC0|tara:strand:- start:24718 stop:25983 length:1266 start_codon:yes stop_codon:yes gene_type:complete
MKNNKLHIILFLLFSSSLVAQNKLYVLLKEATHNEANATHTDFFGDFYADFLYTENEGVSTRSDDAIQLAIDYRMGYTDDTRFDQSGSLGDFDYYCQISSPFPGDTGDLDYNENITLNSYKRIIYNGPSDLGPDDVGDTCLPLNYIAIYVPSSVTPTGAVCDDAPLFDFYNGSSTTIPFLTWKYQRDNGQWALLPNHRNTYPLDASVTDIFGTNPDTYFTGVLKVQYTVEAQFSNAVYYSPIHTITIAPKTPGIQNLTVAETNCVYTNDGSFNLNFDSNIAGDQLLFNLRKGSTSGPLFTRTETINGSNYSWPENLNPDNYYLTYQTLPNGCDRTFGPITIGSPDPMAYTISANDISCFAANDGKIIINIDSSSPGTAPYKYTINGGAPVNFSSTTTSIQNLGPNSYNIQVFDQNDCTQRL